MAPKSFKKLKFATNKFPMLEIMLSFFNIVSFLLWQLLKDALLPSVSPLITIISAFIAFGFASQEFLERNIILFVLPIGVTIAKLHILLIVSP